MDRIVFVCFCEDLNFLPNNIFTKLLKTTQESFVETTIWEQVKGLFNAIDKGYPQKNINKFNGGLFAKDEELDSLTLQDEILTEVVKISDWDFASELSVNILGHIFEQSITDLEEIKAQIQNEEFDKKQGKRKKDGVFYTPEYITRYIVEEAVGGWLNDKKQELKLCEIEPVDITAIKKTQKWKNPNEELINRYKQYAEILESIKILDPACGSGAFLVAVFEFLENEWIATSEALQKLGDEWQRGLFSYSQMYKHILKNNIFGVDLNPESTQITKLSLWLKTASLKEELTSLDDNIKCGNSLIDDPEVETGWYFNEQGDKTSKAFKWQASFPQVFASGGFDVVVGNPPYVRQERFSDIKSALQKDYQVYTGVADLYCYFYEKGTNILQKNGRLGFITSNKWMRAKYGEPLRKYILEKTKIQNFVDLSGQEIFEGVGVDANILVYRKQEAQNYEFKVSNNLQEHSTFESTNLSTSCFNIESNSLQRQIKEKMESIGTPLKDWNVKIYRGILTGYNEAFIIDTPTKEEICRKDAKSEEIIKPILRGRDISRYGYEWAGLWVINSHNGYASTPRINIEKDYPAVYEHLLKFEKECQKRSDKGEHWTNLRNCAYVEDFSKEKVVWQEIVSNSSFTYIEEEFYCEATTFLMVGNNLKFLTILLNSKFCTWSFKSFYAGGGLGNLGFRYKKVFLEQLPIPQIEIEQQTPFVEKAQTMLDLTKQFNELSNKFTKLLGADLGVAKITKKLQKWYNLQADEFFAEVGKQNKNLSLSQKSQWLEHFEVEKQKAIVLQNQITKTDTEIDRMVYKLYGLTQEEIEVIEK